MSGKLHNRKRLTKVKMENNKCRKYPFPPFPPQHQETPGIEAKMNPRPDYGRESYKGSGRLVGKKALITGGDSGIGRAVAVAFAREGADIAISYLNEHEDAEETKKVVEEAGRECLLFPGDITHEEQVKKVVQGTVDKFKRIDVLVNNAGWHGPPLNDFLELDRERVVKVFHTNVIPTYDFLLNAIPHMPRGSSIINCVSIQAFDPILAILDYASTKGALVTLTKGLAQWAMPAKGIRVNAVAPGPVWTPLIMQSYPADQCATFGEQFQMKRPAQPVELAPSFVYLASDESSYTNAEIIGVTGGMILK